MHKTHLPLRMWIQAMWLMTTSSKGISSLKLGEWLGIQRRTAWHLAHRVRAMMAEDSPMLRGIVEIDETYAGAPPRKRNTGDDDPADPPDAPQGPTGRGTKRPLVLVAVERGGKAEARVIATHGKAAIAAALSGKLAADAVVMTDGLPAYKHIGATRTHLAVNHSAKEYARTDAVTGHRVHVNTVESWNGMLRRAIIGVFHSVSTKHLNRYCAETAFRWNHRTGDVLNRLAGLIRNGRGRVLPFRDLVGAAA